jgi:diguanylate cyclase
VLLVTLGAAAPALERALAARGWPVTAAADTRAAVQSLEAGGVDVAVLPELGSPRATVALLRRVAQAAPAARRVVLLREAATDAAAAYANQGAAHRLLAPPLGAGRLIQAIRQEWGRAREERLAWLQEVREEPSLQRLRVLTEERSQALTQSNRELRAALREASKRNKALSALNRSLRIQSTTDPLTGLFNRREFLNRVRTEWGRYRRYGRPLSLIMLDIDRFKLINDTHGHECGDRVLRQLGQLISRNKRAQDLCCRYGGEEFVVLLTETTLEAAFHVAEGLRRLIARQDFQYEGQAIPVRVSLGVSGAAEQQPADVEAFINMADKAMYRAKREGRDRTVVLDAADESRIARQSVHGAPVERATVKAPRRKAAGRTATRPRAQRSRTARTAG